MTVGLDLQSNIYALGTGVQRPNARRNYTVYNQQRVDAIAAQREAAIPYLKEYLNITNDSSSVFEALCAVDKMADMKVQGLNELYPYLARFNTVDCPEVQVMLAGIYRKTLVPDAFGPLCRMLHQQIVAPNSPYFDPTEEIGGAILEYISAYGAKNGYNPASSVNSQAQKINLLG